jgi:hypothetical protein
MFEGIAAERSPGPRWKERFIRVTGPLYHPAAQHRDDRGCQRRDPMLPPFAETADMWTDAEMDVGLS